MSMPRVGATRFDWAPCDAGTRVAHLRLTGAGHGLPPNPPIQGRRSKLDASRAIADFSRHSATRARPGCSEMS
jgi:poly(3-hydroxybutyrate) depolymerase